MCIRDRYVLRYYSLPVTVFRLAPGRLRGNFSTSPQVACVTMTRLGLFFRFFQRSSLVMSVVRNLWHAYLVCNMCTNSFKQYLVCIMCASSFKRVSGVGHRSTSYKRTHKFITYDNMYSVQSWDTRCSEEFPLELVAFSNRWVGVFAFLRALRDRCLVTKVMSVFYPDRWWWWTVACCERYSYVLLSLQSRVLLSCL